MIALIFFLLAGVAVLSALTVLLARKVIYAAFALLVVLLSISGIYVLLAADFLAVTQLVVYIGGVLTLLIFGVMFTRSPSAPAPTFSRLGKIKGLLLGALFFLLLSTTIWQINLSLLPTAEYPIQYQESTIGSIGKLLMTDFILPFELAALLLLMALVGATFIAGKSTK